MLELRDLALGIAAALQAVTEPEPLAVNLWNHSPETAAYLVTAVLEECSDAGVTWRGSGSIPGSQWPCADPLPGIGGRTGTSP